jgi:uncharacterized membrane protein
MSDWYYAANNEQKGPINESELKANFAGNKLPADTLVWKDGMDNWTPANQVSAFTFRAAPTPAKVQPSIEGAATTRVTAGSPAASNPSSTTPVDMTTLMGTPESLEVTPEDAEKNKIYGILAYVPIPLPLLWLIPLLAAKDSPFAKYHANQGFVLFILELALWFVLTVLNYIFFMVGLSFLAVFLSIAWLGILVLVILGVVNAAAGKCVPLPVIGGIKLLK